MREIKFRAWDKINKIMIYDLELIYENYIDNFRGFKWMQFIGLKDKNRKEIYSGDILNWDNKCTILIKEKDELGFYYEVLTQKDKNVVSFDIRFYRSEESAEIIGNIYENPELLNNVISAEGDKE